MAHLLTTWFFCLVLAGAGLAAASLVRRSWNEMEAAARSERRRKERLFTVRVRSAGLPFEAPRRRAAA